MATTFLTLTNDVLRELNEIELTSSTFASAKGIQSFVKDAVNKSLKDVSAESLGSAVIKDALTKSKIKLKGYSVIHLGALSLYTKHVEIFIPMGPPQYIMTMCQRILANYSPSQRYWQICLIFNFVLSTERNYATISNGPMKNTFWTIT